MPYEKWCIMDLLYNNDYIIMQIIKPELAHQIHKRKIPTLANLCRKSIPYKTRIEIQGTYINDVVGIV